MNHMIDEMRLRCYEVYGPYAYNRATSQAERDKTAERLSQMSLDQMLYCVGGDLARGNRSARSSSLRFYINPNILRRFTDNEKLESTYNNRHFTPGRWTMAL